MRFEFLCARIPTIGGKKLKIFCTLGGAGLFALSLTASALSLGQSQGQVVLGAPLDLVFELQTDAGRDVAESCVGAELLLGERRVAGSRVHITPLPARADHFAAVRVQASMVIDEPVVVVQLSAGCEGRISRNYTFFAELPAVAAHGVTPFDIGQLTAVPAVGAAVAADSGVAKPSTRRAEPRKAPPVAAHTQASQVREMPASLPKVANKTLTSAAAVQPEPRLRLEPLDGLPDPRAAGGSAQTSEEVQPVAAGAESAALALAEERVKTLEAEVRAFKSREASQTASLAQMRSEIEALQARAGDSFWTLPLLAALAISLAVLGWLLLRLRSLTRGPGQVWQHCVDASLRSGEPAAAVAEGDSEALVAAPWPDAAMPQAAQTHAAVSSSPGFDPRALLASASVSSAAVHRARDVVKPEELFDVRQQAEFFTSVGEYEQAIAVMREHIADHQDSSPLAYLELLGLFYQLSRQTEFDALCEQFEQHFAVKVPDMAKFAERGRSLEDYPELLSTIEAMWFSDQIGELLESYLFRRSDSSGVLFDLEAFADLLLLQAVARTAGIRGQASGRRDPVGSLAAESASGSLPLADESWAALERATAVAGGSSPSSPALMDASLSLEPNSLSLEIPSDFDVPQGAFARSQPLPSVSTDLHAASPLLDIDLSDVGRWTSLDLPTVESLPFDAQEFPKRSVVGPAVDRVQSSNALDAKRSLNDELELAPWGEEESDSMFSVLNAERTARLVSTPLPEDAVFPDESATSKKPTP